MAFAAFLEHSGIPADHLLRKQGIAVFCDDPGEFSADGPGEGTGSFHYVKEVMSGNTAVLEFESTVDGILVNGIDMITCDNKGRIVEFKVMLRPLKAINLMHAKMKAMIEQMPAG